MYRSAEDIQKMAAHFPYWSATIVLFFLEDIQYNTFTHLLANSKEGITFFRP